MKITLNNIRSRVEGTFDELRRVDSMLTVRHPQAHFIKRHRPGWDGRVRFLRRAGNSFPTGLLHIVRRYFPKAQIVDQRKRPPVVELPHEHFLSGIKLREDQLEVIRMALEKGRGILSLAVNFGKSEIAMALWKALHVPALHLVHRKDLLVQTVERAELRLAGTGTVSAVGDGRMDFSAWKDHGYVVATVQTISKALEEEPDLLRGLGLLILDEVQTVGAAAKWAKIADASPAYYRFGMSGTPLTGDPIRDMTIQGATGPVLMRVTSADLIAKGVSTRPIVEFHYIDNSGASPMDWTEARRTLIEANEVRNCKIVRLAHAAAERGKRVLALCNTVRHMKLLQREAQIQGVDVEIAYGQHGSARRAETLRKLRSGLSLICFATVFDVGTDLPELDVVILAGSGKSAIRQVQRIGRVLRKSPTKKIARVIDFYDSGERLTENHSKARIKICESEGFEIRVIDPDL